MACQLPQFSKRYRKTGRRSAGKQIVQVDLMAIEKLLRHVKLMPRKMDGKCAQQAGNAVGNARRLRDRIYTLTIGSS